MQKFTWGALLLAILGTAACSSSNIDTKDAVRSAMVEYLNANKASTGLDPSAMDVKIEAVQFDRETAHAAVAFLIKGTDQGMHMNYTLTRQGDKWGNVKRQDQTAAPHAVDGGAEQPADQGPGDQGKEPLLPVVPGTSTPPGLPAGHPPVPTGTK